MDREIKYYASFRPNEPYESERQAQKYLFGIAEFLHSEGIGETGAIGEYFDASFSESDKEYSIANIDYELYEISSVAKLVNLLKSIGAPKGSELEYSPADSEIYETVEF